MSGEPDHAAATTFHSWPLLPTELKLEVLSYCVPRDMDITDEIHSRAFNNGGSMDRLIRSRNRDIVNLSFEIYYTSNRFIISMSAPFTNLRHPFCPPPAYRSKIRRLNVKLSCKMEDIVGTSPAKMTSSSAGAQKVDGLRYLFRQRSLSNQALDRCVAWQASFSEARSLRLELNGLVYSTPGLAPPVQFAGMGPLQAGGMGPLQFGPVRHPHFVVMESLPHMQVGPFGHFQATPSRQLGPPHLGSLGAPHFGSSGHHNCGWDPKILKAVKEWLGTVQLDLEADKVNVRFTIDHRANVACGCASSVEDIITKMALKKK